MSGGEGLFDFQVFNKRGGDSGQLGQLKIGISQKTKSSAISI